MNPVRTNRLVRGFLTAALLVAGVLATAAAPAAVAADDPRLRDACTAPAGDPSPGTPEWHERDTLNMRCAGQRQHDLASNVAHRQAYAEALASWPHPERLVPKANNRPGFDPFRVPWSRWNKLRGRYRETWFTDSGGAELHVELFAPLEPCASACPPPPKDVRRLQAPYPGVAWMVGGNGQKQQQWMFAEHLAEAGYLVMLFDPPGAGSSEAGTGSSEPGMTGDAGAPYRTALTDALDWFFSTPARPSAKGDVNPWAALLDRERVGVAGWSLGAIAANRVGQQDGRISAIVGWDTCENIVPEGHWEGVATGCESRPPEGVPKLAVPSLQLSADLYGLSGVAYPMMTPPDPHRLDGLHRAQRAQGVESMQVSLRAATHLDFGAYYVTESCMCSRYGELVSLYFTEAWFDYQLKGARDKAMRRDALGRLTATTFDDSADEHSIGTGTYDPATGNTPYRIGGLAVADRLSFYYQSAYYLRPDGRTVLSCTDMRAGCRAGEGRD